MKVQKMKLSELKQPEKNIRIHSDAQLAEFERSVKMFGQIRPIVVDESGTILAGNGLYATLLRLGWTEADVYKVTGLSEKDKKKLMMADNKIFNLGIDDLDAFETFLVDLDGDFDIPGFDAEILQSMVSMPEEITEVVSEYGFITNEDREAMERAGEAIQSATSTPTEPTQTETADSSDEPAADVRRSVVCPRCGETIWL